MSDMEFHDFRRLGVGGSDANILVKADAAEIEQLRLLKRGEVDPPNFEDILPVQMGNATEAFNAAWTTKKLGAKISDRNARVVSPKLPWHRCNLDGIIEPKGKLAKVGLGMMVWEAKHVGDQFKMDAILGRYMAQLQHNMSVTGLQGAVLTVFYGNARWEHEVVERDDFYIGNLLKLEETFWEAVTKDIPYVPKTIAPPPPAFRPYDMTGNNEWASLAGQWRENAIAASKHEEADKGLRKLVPADASEAKGHGVCLKRSRDGKLRLSME